MASRAGPWDGRFDLVVIGGGLHGACAASLAARNGWKTALLERGDFGGGVSANSLKVIHGGLRYLQHLDFRRMRESIAARSLLLRIAPELVRPRGFVMPLKSSGVRSRPAMSVALALNEWISRDRNLGLEGDHRIPPARLIDRDDVSLAFPAVALPSHRGGALWFDAVAVDTERLTLAFVLDAEREGAVVANYTQVDALQERDGRIVGVVATDAAGGGACTIEARHVLWAGGASWNRLPGLDRFAPAAPGGWVAAMNLVLDVPWNSDWGLAMPAIGTGAARRNFFFVPWRSRLMVGTWYEPVSPERENEPVTPEVLDRLLAEVQPCFPRSPLRREQIVMVHRGLLPAMKPGSDVPSRTVTCRSGTRDGLPDGLTWLQGVKYTTAPAVAALALARIAEGIGAPLHQRTWTSPLRDAVAVAGVLSKSDVERFVRDEHARHLTDLVLRRSGLGSAGPPSVRDLEQLAGDMAGATGWTPEQTAAEIRGVHEHYARLGLAVRR